MTRNQSQLMRVAVVALCVCMTAVHADTYPSKPITIIVPYAAGGATDATARRIAEALSRSMSASVIVDNRPGAATTLAAAYVARAPKDGYTLLMAPGTTTSVNPYIYRHLSYKSEDFAAISLVSKQAFALTATQSLPAKSIAEFVAYAQAKTEGITYGTTGTGSLTNIIGEWIGRTIGIKVTEVPYKGTSPSTIDLIGGRIDTQVEGITNAIPMHVSGKTRIIGVMSETRLPLVPDVPTFREAGYPNLVAYTYFGLLAPAGTPADVINKLHAAVVAAVAAPDFASKLAAGGEVAVSSASPKQYASFLHDEYERWGVIVKPLNLKLD
jgi:tripartite-type tricarboxylate transporter receptor subunit TctC